MCTGADLFWPISFPPPCYYYGIHPHKLQLNNRLNHWFVLCMPCVKKDSKNITQRHVLLSFCFCCYYTAVFIAKFQVFLAPRNGSVTFLWTKAITVIVGQFMGNTWKNNSKWYNKPLQFHDDGLQGSNKVGTVIKMGLLLTTKHVLWWHTI